MFTKEELLASIRHETEVIKHLAGKARAEDLEWRPTEGQRSLAELLAYMTTMGSIVAQNLHTKNWDHAQALAEAAADTSLANFGERMDAQLAFVEEQLSGFDEAGLRGDHAMPWGAPATIGGACVDMILKCYVAYRMQLFLYLKQLGHELATGDCWVGASK